MISLDTVRKLYLDEDLRISEMSDRLGISTYYITKAIKKYNIKIKGISHYNRHPKADFSKEQYEFFDGLIASDGSLVIARSGGRIRNAKISCAFKYREFAEYIYDYLDLNNNSIHKKEHVSDRYKAGRCVQYGVYSQNNVLFTEEHSRWYLDGKKIIPHDFRFSPVSMNILYLGDGHLRKKEKSIILSMNSFNYNHINKFLIRPLVNIGIKCHITNNNNQVFVSKLSSGDFLDYIGGCPVRCYDYKWDL